MCYAWQEIVDASRQFSQNYSLTLNYIKILESIIFLQVTLQKAEREKENGDSGTAVSTANGADKDKKEKEKNANGKEKDEKKTEQKDLKKDDKSKEKKKWDDQMKVKQIRNKILLSSLLVFIIFLNTLLFYLIQQIFYHYLFAFNSLILFFCNWDLVQVVKIIQLWIIFNFFYSNLLESTAQSLIFSFEEDFTSDWSLTVE